MPSINLYAELLLNIQQVTIHATLQSASNGETHVDLSSDHTVFFLTHNGETASIKLPVQVAQKVSLDGPVLEAKELSFRLPVAGEFARVDQSHLSTSNEVPWSAFSLSSETQLACRFCNCVVVDQFSVAHWKSLPNENWAEMMDFWHCHKPDTQEHGTSDASVSTKGYAASNSMSAQAGRGFVDICYFILSEQDCSGIQVRATLPTVSSFQPGILHSRF